MLRFRLLPIVHSSLVAAAIAVGGAGCGHGSRAPAVAEHDTVMRKLLVLEEEAEAFFGRSLSAKTPSTATTKAAIERETAELEGLRMRYLNVLGETKSDRDRVLTMVRLIELHLDLGARIRRANYPVDVTQGERATFDAFLSRKALPLEATAHGLIAQVLDLSRRRGIDGPLVQRTELYARLHRSTAPRSTPLGPLWTPILEREWRAQGPFAAPRRLLEAGRIGQRAARR